MSKDDNGKLLQIHQKIKLDRFLTMAQYSWSVFDRELQYYDLADSMHMMCPPIVRGASAQPDLGGFIVNITPDIPYQPFKNDLREQWRSQIAHIKRVKKPFDFWNVLDGEKLPEGPGFRLFQCNMPKEEYDYLMQEVGDLFLGWEIGEFDGLYGRDVIYYLKEEGRPKTRREAYHLFIKYLKDFHKKLYGNTNALCGATFAHYFNELPVRLLGAEVAQGLLNTQVYVSFLRGACRQYDLQYKIMSSVFDRWGYRCYTDSGPVNLPGMEAKRDGWKAGPYFGHSVGLFQAIWVTGYFAEAAIMGLDGGFYTDEIVGGVRQLSPLGKAFFDFTQWSRNPFPRGEQIRPVALMLDYYSGWTPPRYLYSFEDRVVWHSIPYGPSDHAMDQAYDMFYPGYCKAGYYRDERGFITPTPMGDIVDVLLSDASVDTMGRYPLLWLLSDEIPERGFLERLKTYVMLGGHLIISGRPMIAFAGEFFDMKISENKEQAILSVISEVKEEIREAFFSVYALKYEAPWTVYAETEKGKPFIISRDYGKGKVTFLGVDHGLTGAMTAPGFDMNRYLDYKPDPPFEILHAVKRYIKEYAIRHMPVEIEGKDIYYGINKLSANRYVICLYNPEMERWTGKIKLKNGKGIIEELKGPWSRGAILNGSIISLQGNETAVVTIIPHPAVLKQMGKD